MNEDWKTWKEPAEPSVVIVWMSKATGLRIAVRDGDVWRVARINYSLTWPELLAHIDTYGDGTPPRIVDLAEPESAPKPESAPEPERALAVPCPLCGSPVGTLCCGRHSPRATPHASRIRSAEVAPEAPKPERVLVWKTGDPLDKLKPYAGVDGVEVRAERDGTVVVGPLKAVYPYGVVVGTLAITMARWTIAITAPKPPAPWWLVDSIEDGHIVSWTDAATGELRGEVWWGKSSLAAWREHWDDNADPSSWRVTDVHAPGGPKLIAWNATAEEELA